ncbi:ATP-binding cassette domain-containing protein [Falsirhodobacter sp. alg1]|uniref:thiamine ABC transporter ATP-binding protein n=1 Tax=Falsirhodobacter sp. alg1 TaxID=1472418 RepID=UPI0005EE513A|nr:ATP-binding cassette domain-containing protein [Falsirhodobacter sp. alg1]
MDDFRLTANWRIETGARVAIIGPSGAGKSTLLMALAGFILPSAGHILWNGQDVTRMPPADRPMTTLFQDQNLFPHLSLTQNLGLGISPRLRLRKDDHSRINAALDRVGLGGMGARKPASLSGGQQGRAALARALLRDKPVLMLDEPFAALGPALKTEMLGQVADVADTTGATVLMVTHDPADARRLCGQTILLAEGVAHPPQDTIPLLDHPPPALRAYLG